MEFITTLLIATIPATITGVISYLVARNNSNTQIKSIIEQNKADIGKIIEEHKINLEALKEKHKMDIEIKEKDHNHQIELINLQRDNEMIKSEQELNNSFTATAISYRCTFSIYDEDAK